MNQLFLNKREKINFQGNEIEFEQGSKYPVNLSEKEHIHLKENKYW